MNAADLIMDLTLEQGGGRETQVQPPLNVWTHYFNLDFDNLPELYLRNRGEAWAPPEGRPVVEHDHNWTIEIEGAELPRPAILHMRRTGPAHFDYWVYRPDEDEFHHCDWLLNTIANPMHTKGRRWVIL